MLTRTVRQRCAAGQPILRVASHEQDSSQHKRMAFPLALLSEVSFCIISTLLFSTQNTASEYSTIIRCDNLHVNQGTEFRQGNCTLPVLLFFCFAVLELKQQLSIVRFRLACLMHEQCVYVWCLRSHQSLSYKCVTRACCRELLQKLLQQCAVGTS